MKFISTVEQFCSLHQLTKPLSQLSSNAFVRKWSSIDPEQNAIICKFFSQRPVYISNALKTTAGKALGKKQWIILHPGLINKNDHLYKDLADTFFHELSHLVAFKLALDRGHGDDWKYCLRHFGFTPSRCYDSREFNYKGYEKRKLSHVYNALDGLEFEL